MGKHFPLNENDFRLRGLSSSHIQILTTEAFSYKELSEKLNIPIGTVRSRLNRARLAIAKNRANVEVPAFPGC